MDIYDKILNKLKPIFFTLGLILLMISWNLFFSIILSSFGMNIDNLPDITKIIIMFISDITFLLFLIKIYYKDIKIDFCKFFNKDILNNIYTSFRYWFLGMIIMVTSNILISIITENTLTQNEETIRTLIDKTPLYMAFQVMIYAPITEELIFRKSMSNITKNKYLYIFISGFIFGGLHIITSITSIKDLLFLIPYCSLGFIFAYLYKKTNNIFSTITAHAFHNTLALLLYLLGGA